LVFGPEERYVTQLGQCFGFFDIENRLRLDHCGMAYIDASRTAALQGIDPDKPDLETQKLLSIEPDLASAHVAFAHWFDSFGRQERALAEYQEALRLEPDNAQIHATLANAHESWKNTDLSLAERREAVRLSPDKGSYRESLAIQLESLKRLPEAEMEFRELVVRDPENQFASRHLVDLLVAQKNMVAAIAELRRFLKVASQAPDGLPVPETVGKSSSVSWNSCATPATSKVSSSNIKLGCDSLQRMHIFETTLAIFCTLRGVSIPLWSNIEKRYEMILKWRLPITLWQTA